VNRLGRLSRLQPPGLNTYSAVYVLAAIYVVFGFSIPNTFLTPLTLRLTLSGQVVTGIVALALLIPLLGGTFDLSVGAMVAFSLAIISWFGLHTHVNIAVACLIAVAACAVVGAISGFIVVRLRVDSFIATLGMSQVLAAAALYISQNQDISGVFSHTFLNLVQKTVFGMQLSVYYLLILALVLWYVLERTPLGRRLFAAGANPEAARLSGVRTDRLVWGSLVSSAVIAGLGGIIYGSQVGAFSNSFGAPLLFPAFAAVFFGATQVKQRPNVWGTMLALYTLAFGVEGIQLAFVQGVYWITPAFNGAALIIAVAIARRHVAAMRRQKVVKPPKEVAAPDVQQPRKAATA
jgi:ribose transport system permease protein